MLGVAPLVSPLECLVRGDIDVLEVLVRAVGTLTGNGQGALRTLGSGEARDGRHDCRTNCCLEKSFLLSLSRNYILSVCVTSWIMMETGGRVRGQDAL